MTPREQLLEVIRARRTPDGRLLDAIEAAAVAEARTAMYGLISARVMSGEPGDWMRFENDVNVAFDALIDPESPR